MSKECIEEQMLWEYIDDELCVKERLKVKQRLDECPCCAEKYREIRSFESQLTVGFNNNFFDCSDIPSSAHNCKEKRIESASHVYQYKFLWKRLVAVAIVTLVSAIVVVALMCPYVHDIPMELEFNWLRFFLISMLALAVKPISMVIIGIVGAVGAGWSLMGARS